jgi:hypothetical protein
MRRGVVVLLARLAVVVAALPLTPSRGAAQTPAQPSRPGDGLIIDARGASDARADPPSKMRIDFGLLTETTADDRRAKDPLLLFTPRDRLWEFRTGRSFELGKGLVGSAQLVGRRGYRLPLYLAEPVGADRSTFDLPNFAGADMSQFEIDWVAKVRIEKTLVQRRTWNMRLVGEVLAPLNHGDRAASPQPASLLNSRAIKLGLVLGF